MINWKVRLLNKNFWLAIIPAILLLAQAVLSVFGITADFGGTAAKLVAVVNAAFVVMAILGIVTDPTTEGISDSIRAMGYTKPKAKDSDDDDLGYSFTWATLLHEAAKLSQVDQDKIVHELIKTKVEGELK